MSAEPVFDAFLLPLRELDVAAFQSINGFCGRSLLLDHIANRLDTVQLKGLVLLCTFGVLWFRRSKDQTRQRETIILVLLSVVLSLVVARVFADLLPFRQRPMFTSGIDYRTPLFQFDAYFEDWSSFPSDTSAVVFTLTTGFWLLSRAWGLIWACFAIISMAARIYFGLHYPGDILAGALVGIGVTLAINNEFMHAHVAAPIVAVEQRAPALFYGLLFPFLYEVSNLFWFTRSLRHTVMQLLLHL
jgi:undecaprenyl-diphosphatase